MSDEKKPFDAEAARRRADRLKGVIFAATVHTSRATGGGLCGALVQGDAEALLALEQVASEYPAALDQIAELEAEVERLRGENEELSRGGVRWWHEMRKVAKVLGVKKLSDVCGAVEELKAELSAARKNLKCPDDTLLSEWLVVFSIL